MVSDGHPHSQQEGAGPIHAHVMMDGWMDYYVFLNLFFANFCYVFGKDEIFFLTRPFTLT